MVKKLAIDQFALVLNICIASQAVLTTIIFWFTWRKRPDLRDWFFALIIFSIGHIILIFRQQVDVLSYVGNGILIIALLIVIISTFNEYYHLILKPEPEKQIDKKERRFVILTFSISFALCLLVGLFLTFFVTINLIVILALLMIALLNPINTFIFKIYLKFGSITRVFIFYSLFVGTITAITTILTQYTIWGSPLNYAANFAFVTMMMTAGLMAPIEKRLTDSEEKYRELSLNLEDEVDKQTIQLQEAFQELEAFSYSVSHDLRSPLRSINGFSSALTDEYNDILDEKGKDYLERIKKNSKRMDDLIKDLLDLSSISRYNEVTSIPVNLSKLAKEVLDDLLLLYPDIEFRYTIQDDLSIRSDPKLIRIVIDNLLGNALKFSSGKANPIIEFGKIVQENRVVFYVKDNGVGFDMKYSDKLFNVFQRLHSNEEFDGTGIGLATVKRIFQKINGKIWADGKVDEGATFFFTIN